MKLGDSRTPEGPGILPGQDHRTIDPDVRSAVVAVRIISRDGAAAGGLPRHDETVQGDVQGLSVWGPERQARPCAMWRHAWPCVVSLRGPAITAVTPGSMPAPWQDAAITPGGGGSWGGGTIGDVPPNSRYPVIGPGFYWMWPWIGWGGP